MKKRVDMLSGNILSSLVKLALPIMATSLIQMAYNMTDMIWIGRVGSTAVTAIGTAGMYMWIAQGVAIMPKIGGQVKVAHAIGSNNLEYAKKITNTILQLTIVLALIYSLFLFFGNHSLIAFYNLSNPATILHAENYLKIISVGLIFTFFNFVMTGILTATGDSKSPFKANTMGLIVNIILDPFLIFGVWIFPELGVSGAAFATVIAQFAVSIYFVKHIIDDNYLFNDIKLLQKSSYDDLKSIIRVGFPSSMQTIGFAFISMVISRYVTTFGDEAIAVQRVGAQIESVTWMTSEGFSAAINTFIAQNYGAKNLKRAKKGYVSALKLISVWGIFTTLLLYFGSTQIFQIFITEPALLSMGDDYLKILGLSQLFMCFEILTSGAFAGFGKTSIPSTVILILTVSRIPAAILLATLLGSINGVWWAISLSSVLKGCILIFIFKIYVSKIEKNLV
jgi:putative MATE family efflux protein